MDLRSNSLPQKSRTKVANKNKWKSTVRKQKHEAGESYVSRRGKLVPQKQIQTTKNCQQHCKFSCSTKISSNERQSLFKSFYKLTTNEKRHFILNSTERCLTKRPQGGSSQRTTSFSYFLIVRNLRIRVCKQFYLGTLNISQKPVYTAHNTKNSETNLPAPDMRGKTVNSLRKLPEELKFNVMSHIQSFPTVEAHYCRANTTRQYLDSNLSVAKMYDLYKETCEKEQTSPVKLSMYRRIFVTHFNLGFHEPKSDKCDTCELYRLAKTQSNTTEKMEKKFEKHTSDKILMRNEREKDKKQSVPVLVFDLQNVINIPRTEISSFYYRRKFNVYNLTGYFTTTKTVYCILWTEAQSGRTGNYLASAFKKLLDTVATENDFNDLITWSDSCVPQNRNQLISNAVLEFLKENPRMNSVTTKYSVPSHSCCQEVDSADSVIEKAMTKTEVFSPLGLVHLMEQINKNRPFRVIQLNNESDFKDFSTTAKLLNYKIVPFTKIASIKFSQILHEIEYKLTHHPNEEAVLVNIRYLESKRRTGSVQDVTQVIPKPARRNKELPNEKQKDLKEMLKYMPEHDKEYYSALLQT
ncbi:hypothetical protein ANN_18200 [Periplaneta americana]|uniref:Uncharacterized protein n=1 Tax=Periplaneta americana TaxID=6978 RepID=A0ABQ8SN33_PERAM|nr:hypothetical protein ANN_18200 [Periplaneta americana]